jgi:hypothetical protein
MIYSIFIKHCDLYNYADDNTLSFHSPNFDEVVNVLQQESNISPIFQIGTANISCDEVVKLLGVDIDFMLNFDCHIKNIFKKAVQQLNILKRIGKNLSKLNRLTIFHTFVLSNLNFCPLSWHFCSETNTKKIEKIQERALRFVYQDYEASYENLLIKAKMPTQHIRRIKTKNYL